MVLDFICDLCVIIGFGMQNLESRLLKAFFTYNLFSIYLSKSAFKYNKTTLKNQPLSYNFPIKLLLH